MPGRTRIFIACGLLALCFGLSANARMISVKPIDGLPGKIIDAPARALDDTIASATHMIGFDERQNVLLSRDLPVDGGHIKKGTWVDSHMILFNLPDARSNGGDEPTEWFTGAQAENEWNFSGPVIGVMSDMDGQLEAASSDLLGAPKTTYPAGSQFLRGFEDFDSYDGVGTTRLRVRMSVWQPGDWIRVITRAAPIAKNGRDSGQPQISATIGTHE